MEIFVSYASEHGDDADRIVLTLRKAGHRVFLDRDASLESQDYDARIREAVARCDLFVFLITPEAVEPGAYARTELGYARDRWPDPTGRVLPVLIAPTEHADVPPYAAAVGILKPEGNAPAEVAACVERLASPRRRRLLIAAGGACAAVAAAAAVAYGGRQVLDRDEVRLAPPCLLTAELRDGPPAVRLSTLRVELATEGQGASQFVLTDEGRAELHAIVRRDERWSIDVRDSAGERLFFGDVVGCPKDRVEVPARDRSPGSPRFTLSPRAQ